MYLLKKIFVISTILLIKVILMGCTNTSTVCYGPLGIPCTTHTLSCPSPLVIQIINTTYGYRSGCNNINGITTCTNTTCCNEEQGDCFVSFLPKDYQRVANNCIGEQSCTVFGFREASGTKCDGTTSTFSKIEYECVIKVISTTTSTKTTPVQTISQPISTSTETVQIPTSQTTSTISSNRQDDEDTGADVGSIVGGLFGAIIIIVIIIVVVVFLYKRKKNSATPPETDNKTIQTPQYHVIDGPGTINNRKDISGYDEIELDSKPRVTTTTDNYDHVGDDKPKPSKEHDNYNHIGSHSHSIDEDNYNYIGNNLSSSANHFESDYNHINGVRGTFNDEDDYNHIGDNDNKKVITDDNYHHIGSGDIKVEGDYDHIHDDNDIVHSDSDNLDDSEAPYNFATC